MSCDNASNCRASHRWVKVLIRRRVRANLHFWAPSPCFSSSLAPNLSHDSWAVDTGGRRGLWLESPLSGFRVAVHTSLHPAQTASQALTQFLSLCTRSCCTLRLGGGKSRVKICCASPRRRRRRVQSSLVIAREIMACSIKDTDYILGIKSTF